MIHDSTLNYDVPTIEIDPADLNKFPYGSMVISQVENVKLKISPDPNVLPRVVFTAHMCSSGLVFTFLKKIQIHVDTDGQNQSIDFPFPIANCQDVIVAVVAKAVEILEKEEGEK